MFRERPPLLFRRVEREIPAPRLDAPGTSSKVQRRKIQAGAEPSPCLCSP